MNSSHREFLILFQNALRAAAGQVCAVLLVFVCCGSLLRASGPPEVIPFAPGAIPVSAPNSAAPTFTVDGKTVYFGQVSGGTDSSIVYSHWTKGQWSAPAIAVFSGRYRDLEPSFAPDGTYLVFASSRPATPGGSELDGYYNGKSFPGWGGNLWKVRWTKKGWQEPERLPDVINTNSSVFSPSLTADGSLYFMRADDGGVFHIYRSQMRNGRFQTPVLASFSDATKGEYDPAVSPDESYLIFSSKRPPAPNTTDLFIVFRTANGWGDPVDLRSAISERVHGIEARLSPDGKTLYFANSTNASGLEVPQGRFIWQVGIDDLLRADRPAR